MDHHCPHLVAFLHYGVHLMWEWIENIVGFIASVLAGLFFAMASILFIAYLLLVLTK